MRYHALDTLRATMISIVMFGHALLPYVTVPRSFKDPQTHIGFDAVAIFLYSFAMPVFFVTAGFAAALLYDKYGFQGVVRSRYRAILLPLLIAYPLLTPLTRGAYVFAKEAANTGSLHAATEVFLLGDWLRLGKAYHLWFLVSLLLYTALALLLRRALLLSLGERVSSLKLAARRLIASPWRALLLAILTLPGMVAAFTLYDGDATTLPMQLVLFGYFVCGWVLFANRDLLPAICGGAQRLILAALLLAPLAIWSSRERLLAGDEISWSIGSIAGASNALLAALMTFGLLGWFQRRYNHQPSAGMAYISAASYWIFLIHFPLVIAAGGLLSVTAFPAIVKYVLTLCIVVPVVLATYHIGVRATPLGRALKGRKLADSS